MLIADLSFYCIRKALLFFLIIVASACQRDDASILEILSVNRDVLLKRQTQLYNMLNDRVIQYGQIGTNVKAVDNAQKLLELTANIEEVFTQFDKQLAEDDLVMYEVAVNDYLVFSEKLKESFSPISKRLPDKLQPVKKAFKVYANSPSEQKEVEVFRQLIYLHNIEILEDLHKIVVLSKTHIKPARCFYFLCGSGEKKLEQSKYEYTVIVRPWRFFKRGEQIIYDDIKVNGESLPIKRLSLESQTLAFSFMANEKLGSLKVSSQVIYRCFLPSSPKEMLYENSCVMEEQIKISRQ